MKTAYFDCFSGASGDMILGALLEAGLDLGHLSRELEKLGLSHYRLRSEQVTRAGFKGTHFIVETKDSHHHHHSHRNLAEIEKIINKSDLDEAIKAKSVHIFRNLAQAEALVHNTEVDQVHFHEVGALDSFIDIVGAVIGMRALGIEKVYCSPLHVGRGYVQCHHGILPVPAPATAQLLKGVPFYSSQVEGELLTPTGAAILTTMASAFGPMPQMVVNQIGYGAGSRQLPVPNLLRLFVGETQEGFSSNKTETVAVIETSIDDMSPQIYEYVMNKMMELGAFEVFLEPVQMKKNRPGTLLTVICEPRGVNRFIDCLLKETTTIGVRWRYDCKVKAPSEILEVSTEYGQLRCKVTTFDSEVINISPEYEDCRRAATKFNVPLKDVLAKARTALADTLNTRRTK